MFGPACANLPAKPVAGVDVHGKVVDAMDRPLSGVEILFRPASKWLIGFPVPDEVTTDSAGTYQVHLAAGEWVAHLYPPSWVALDYGDYTAPYPDQVPVTVSLDQPTLDLRVSGFRVEGRVRGATGAPLDSFYVGADGIGGEFAWSFFRGGRFSLLLPASTYDFSAGSGDYYDGNPNVVHPGVPIHADTTLDLVLAGNLMTGLVTGPGGAPLESTIVTASGAEIVSRARTSPDGRYSLYIPPGLYRFICEPRSPHQNILTRISDVRSVNVAGTIDWDLSGVTLSGTARSLGTLTPLPGVRATAVLFADAYHRTAISITDAAGQFRLTLEPNREYSLSFLKDGVGGLEISSFVATSSDSTFDVLIPDPVP